MTDKKLDNKHEWRAYGQPVGLVVCDDCNLAADVNDLLKAERNRVLDELKQRFLMYTAKHDQAMRDEVLGVIKKIRRDE